MPHIFLYNTKAFSMHILYFDIQVATSLKHRAKFLLTLNIMGTNRIVSERGKTKNSLSCVLFRLVAFYIASFDVLPILLLSLQMYHNYPEWKRRSNKLKTARNNCTSRSRNKLISVMIKGKCQKIP